MTECCSTVKNSRTDVDYKQSKELPTVTKEGNINLPRFSYRYVRVFVLRELGKEEPEITGETAALCETVRNLSEGERERERECVVAQGRFFF
jgi:hypothetical protein